eukprot:GHVT01078645.1.p1 GENE.GHVT01078645.1~~GHVT01078645.1.p1  ORF type:complete len:250 (-),score=5.42 GHVT01078645.1:520-1269(-)
MLFRLVYVSVLTFLVLVFCVPASVFCCRFRFGVGLTLSGLQLGQSLILVNCLLALRSLLAKKNPMGVAWLGHVGGLVAAASYGSIRRKMDGFRNEQKDRNHHEKPPLSRERRNQDQHHNTAPGEAPMIITAGNIKVFMDSMPIPAASSSFAASSSLDSRWGSFLDLSRRYGMFDWQVTFADFQDTCSLCTLNCRAFITTWRLMMHRQDQDPRILVRTLAEISRESDIVKNRKMQRKWALHRMANNHTRE